jgi:hypothetical protein
MKAIVRAFSYLKCLGEFLHLNPTADCPSASSIWNMGDGIWERYLCSKSPINIDTEFDD